MPPQNASQWLRLNRCVLTCSLVAGSLAASFRPGLGETSQANAVPNDVQTDAAKAATPRLPAPSGTYGIGRLGYEWTDVTRPDGHSTDPQAHRDLMVYLWYPSSYPAPEK
jgi:hypothetical protein